MLTKVSWPSPIPDVVICGWRYEGQVSVDRVLEVAPDIGDTGPGSVGTRRWVEWSLARQAALDALDELGQHRDQILVSDSGAPQFASAPFGLSIAHTHGIALAAVGHGRVGVDVESVERDVSRLESTLLPGEGEISLSLGLLEVFVAKEAAAKATGEGLGGSLSRWPVVDVELFGESPQVTVCTPTGEFVDVRVWESESYVVALAAIPPS